MSRPRSADRPTEYVRTAPAPPTNAAAGKRLLAAKPGRQVGDRQRRAEPRARRHSEQVGIDERVAEHALIGRARERSIPPTSAASTTRGMRISHRIDSSVAESEEETPGMRRRSASELAMPP